MNIYLDNLFNMVRYVLIRTVSSYLEQQYESAKTKTTNFGPKFGRFFLEEHEKFKASLGALLFNYI